MGAPLSGLTDWTGYPESKLLYSHPDTSSQYLSDTWLFDKQPLPLLHTIPPCDTIGYKAFTKNAAAGIMLLDL